MGVQEISRRLIDGVWRTGRADDGGGGNGGSQPSALKRARYFGLPVTCPGDASRVFLTLDTKISGDDILDLSTPSHPVVVEEGVYAVTAVFQQVDGLIEMTPGAVFQIFLALDAANDGTDIDQQSPSAGDSGAPAHPLIAASTTFYIPAGGIINVALRNLDVGVSQDFACNEFEIQQIVAAS